jgi:hypothetical protein
MLKKVRVEKAIGLVLGSRATQYRKRAYIYHETRS